jgi:hypothetical protein
VLVLLRPRSRALWLLPSAPPPSPSPPLGAYQLSQPLPHPKIQKHHPTTTSICHLTHSVSEIMLSPLPPIGQQLPSPSLAIRAKSSKKIFGFIYITGSSSA